MRLKENKILPALQRTSTTNADLSALSTLNRGAFDSLILVLFMEVVKYALLSEYQGVICLSHCVHVMAMLQQFVSVGVNELVG